MASKFSGVDDGCESGVSLCTLFGAETADHLAVNDRWSAGAFTGTIVKGHTRVMQEQQKLVAVCHKAREQCACQLASGFGLQQLVQTESAAPAHGIAVAYNR